MEAVPWVVLFREVPSCIRPCGAETNLHKVPVFRGGYCSRVALCPSSSHCIGGNEKFAKGQSAVPHPEGGVPWGHTLYHSHMW